MDRLLSKGIVLVFLHSLCLGLFHFAHQKNDPLWISSYTTIIVALLIAGPLLAGYLFWIRQPRAGGILLMGSLPASLFFIIQARFFHSHITVPVEGISAFWGLVYQLSVLLLLIIEVYGALLAVRILRNVHAPSA